MMGATRKPGCVTVLLCFCCNDLNLNLTATLVRRPAIIEGDEEHNRDEGAEKNGEVGGGGNGHALTGEEEGRSGSLERHLGGDGGGAGGTAGSGELVAGARRPAAGVGGPQGEGRRGGEGLRRGEEGNAEESDTSGLHRESVE